MTEEVKKVDGMFMENLEEWILEEQKVVTYKYLARALKVHVNVAKQMLFNFVDEQRKKDTELGIVYLVSGNLAPIEDGVSKLKVLLVEEKNVDKELKKFKTVISRHIYSVQKAGKITSTGLFATDLVSLKEDVMAANAQAAIKNKAAVPRPNHQIDRKVEEAKKPVKQEVKKEPKPEVEIKKPGKPSSIESAFSKTKKKSPEKDGAADKKPVATTTSSAGKKQTSNIAAMFAKQASAKPKVKTEVLTSETSPGKENMENAQIEDKKTAEAKVAEKKEPPKQTSFGKKSAPAKKPASKSKKSTKGDSKKRKRITVASDSESDGDDDKTDEDEEKAGASGEEEQDEEEQAPPQSRIIQSDEEEEEEIPSTPQPSQSSTTGRRRVRKMVDKTYIDEKGYMVTKKEAVFESEDEPEAEEEPVKKPEAKVEKAASSSGPAAKKPKLMSAGTSTKQQGIMAFFKKK